MIPSTSPIFRSLSYCLRSPVHLLFFALLLFSTLTSSKVNANPNSCQGPASIGMKDQKEHWEEIYRKKANIDMSWYVPHLDASLSMIENLNLSIETPIIDVGSGDSTLVDDLLLRGFRNITLLDISSLALEVTCKRLGNLSSYITSIDSDITTVSLPPQSYGLWHDRAVFHFLTDINDIKAYLKNLNEGLQVNGYAILATFSKDGPEECSQLPITRYSISELEETIGEEFNLIESSVAMHVTPWKSVQPFTYCLFQKIR